MFWRWCSISIVKSIALQYNYFQKVFPSDGELNHLRTKVVLSIKSSYNIKIEGFVILSGDVFKAYVHQEVHYALSSHLFLHTPSREILFLSFVITPSSKIKVVPSCHSYVMLLSFLSISTTHYKVISVLLIWFLQFISVFDTHGAIFCLLLCVFV